MAGKIIIFAAPSGAGKSSIIKKLIENEKLNLSFSVSATSRQKRTGEIEGKDYFFISETEFNKKIKNDEFIEWEQVYSGTYYGTLKSEVISKLNDRKNVIFDIDVVGALNIKKIFSENAISIFIMPPSIEILEKRLKNRNTETEEDIKKRISKAEYEITFSDKFDEIIINDILENSIKKTEELILNFIENK